MSQALAQILLAIILLTAAITFELLGQTQIAIGLVGAVLGQGVGITVQTTVNGNNKKKEG